MRDVVVKNGIVSTDDDPTESETINCTNKWILPGFIDAHFHAYAISLEGLENEAGYLSLSAIKGSRRLRAALRRGFTTVRDVAGGDYGLKMAVDNRLIESPRYLFTGPAFSQTGGHGDPRSNDFDMCFSTGHMCEIVDGVNDIRRVARERFRKGAHALKIMTSGGVFSVGDPLTRPQYFPEEIRAASDEARRRGSYVTAHSYSVEGIMMSIENGVTCIEHGNLIDEETVEAMASRGVHLVPTLAAYDAMDRRGAKLGLNEISLAKNKEVLVRGQEACRIALRANVNLGFGTDLMGDLDDDQLRGISLQVEAIGARETIHSLTVANARILGDEKLGNLADGCYGDAVVLDSNPLDTPEALYDVSQHYCVVKDGEVVDRGGSLK
ncbi:metal-dependent hydrolase family protein [Brevibacterium casei]|nr:amidohydrolase family protein [Brevibacterium casei]